MPFGECFSPLQGTNARPKCDFESSSPYYNRSYFRDDDVPNYLPSLTVHDPRKKDEDEDWDLRDMH